MARNVYEKAPVTVKAELLKFSLIGLDPDEYSLGPATMFQESRGRLHAVTI